MREFEELLPQALMDANLAQFQRTLDGAGDWDASPGYRRSRLRLIQDPIGWMRSRERPPWKRAARQAACILLACAVALGSLMAVSPTIRAAVFHWVREFTGTQVTYSPMDQKTEVPPSWRPAWLPEAGWYVGDIIATGNRVRWTLNSSEPIGDMYGHITCTCDSPGSGGATVGSDQEYTQERTTVQGVPADYYENEYNMMLFWESPQGHLLSVSMSGMDRAALERMAESMTFYAGTDIRYTVGWTPEDCEELSRFENIGVGQTEWLCRNDMLTFRYITDPPCAMASPDRAFEEVTVNGLPARYWPCLVPEEETGVGQTMNLDGVQITTGITHSPDEAALLLWEDPETRTSFQLTGLLSREESIRMAESITPEKLP